MDIIGTGTDWACAVVNPHLCTGYLVDLAATAEEIGRLRWTLGQVITLADQAPALADEQLRARLLALTESGTR